MRRVPCHKYVWQYISGIITTWSNNNSMIKKILLHNTVVFVKKTTLKVYSKYACRLRYVYFM